METKISVQKVYLDIINQIFEIEKKTSQIKESNSIHRNLKKLKEIFETDFSTLTNGETAGFYYHNPVGEPYNETRTDCEASIAGTSTDNLVITEVIKPIIHYKVGGLNLIIQKAVVVAESKK